MAGNAQMHTQPAAHVSAHATRATYLAPVATSASPWRHTPPWRTSYHLGALSRHVATGALGGVQGLERDPEDATPRSLVPPSGRLRSDAPGNSCRDKHSLLRVTKFWT